MRPSETALVCGSAACLWSDLTLVGPTLESHATIIAVNATGFFLPRVNHVVSVHGNFPAVVRHVREHMDMVFREHEPAIVTHSTRSAPGVDRVWAVPSSGTSSLFGVRVALGLGFHRIICCGVPLDSSGRFYDDPRRVIWDWAGGQGEQMRKDWIAAAKDEFAGQVRSCSGWTRHLLGGPEEWLSPEQRAALEALAIAAR